MKTRAATEHLDQLEELGAAPEAAIAHLRHLLQTRLNRHDGAAGDEFEPMLRRMRRELIAVETAAHSPLSANRCNCPSRPPDPAVNRRWTNVVITGAAALAVVVFSPGSLGRLRRTTTPGQPVREQQ